MWYALWNESSGNIVGEFDTEAEALAEVRAMVAESGRDVVAHWMLALGPEAELGDDSPPLTGDKLLDRALGHMTTAAE